MPDVSLTERLMLKFKDSIIYVFDWEQQFLLLFSWEGEFLQQIGGKGEGPGEIDGVSGFDVFGDIITFLRPAGNESIIYRFRDTGEFLEQRKIEVSAGAFIQTGPSSYVFDSGYNVEENDHQLYKYNLNDSSLVGILPHVVTVPKMPMEGSSLTHISSDEYIFWPTYRPTLNYYVNDKLNHTFDMDYGPYLLGEDFDVMPPMEAAEHAFSNGFYQPSTFISNGDYLLIQGALVKSFDDQGIYITLADLKNNQYDSKKLEQGTFDEALLSFYSFDENYIYSLADGYILEKFTANSDLGDMKGNYYLVRSKMEH